MSSKKSKQKEESQPTKIFEKIIRYNRKTPLSILSPTKYSMSSKDWAAALKDSEPKHLLSKK